MRSLLVRIAGYGLFLWGVSEFLPQLGFSVVYGAGTSYGIALVVVAAALWAMEHVVKKILTLVTLPLNIVTLGLASFVVNVVLLYVLQAVVGVLPGVDVGIQLGSFLQVILLSIVLSVVGRFISFLL